MTAGDFDRVPTWLILSVGDAIDVAVLGVGTDLGKPHA